MLLGDKVTAPEFSQPFWLLLLPVVPILIAWWLRRKPLTLRFPDTSVVAAINTPRGAISRCCGAIGRGLAWSVAVIALAGPRWPDPGSRVPTEGIAILLVFDVSNSMNEPDFMWDGKPTTRLTAMKRAFRTFVAGGAGPQGEELSPRPNDMIGLVTFTRRPKSSCPLTLSHDALLQMLDREETNKGGHDFDTNVGDAIAWGVHRLNTSPFKHKVMIIATDGEQSAIPEALRPRQGAQFAGHFGIPIMVIDPGSDAPLKGDTPADKFAAENRRNATKSMQEVAKMTGGQYYATSDSKGLFEALVNLGGELDRIEREKIETFRYRRYWEGYAWFGGAALILMFTVMGLELTLWRRLP